MTLITTGGTIASVSDEAGVRRPILGARDLLGSAGHRGEVRVREVLCKDSSLLDFADLDQIRRAVSEEVADPATVGVVVAHGTDTLEETAMLLDLMAAGGKPVAITGAALPASDPEADGPRNLRDALAFVADGEARGGGVVVCFAGERLAARGAHKRHTGGVDVFGGRPHRGAASGASAKLPGRDIAGTRVDIVGVYPGADRTALDAHVAAGARGLVLETMGNGGVPGLVAEAVAEHAGAGVAVVACSRVPGAPVTGSYSGGARLVEAGAVLAQELRASQARMQLAALLVSGLDVRSCPW